MDILEVRVSGRRLVSRRDRGRSVVVTGQSSRLDDKPPVNDTPAGRVEDVLVTFGDDDYLSLGHEADGRVTIHYGTQVLEIKDGNLWTMSRVRDVLINTGRYS